MLLNVYFVVCPVSVIKNVTKDFWVCMPAILFRLLAILDTSIRRTLHSCLLQPSMHCVAAVVVHTPTAQTFESRWLTWIPTALSHRMSKQSGLFNKRVRPAIDPAQPYKVQKLTASALASCGRSRSKTLPRRYNHQSQSRQCTQASAPSQLIRHVWRSCAGLSSCMKKKNDATLALLGRVEQLLKARTGNDDTGVPVHRFESTAAHFRSEVGLFYGITPSTLKENLQMALH
jgi:hypothetical protein